MYQFCAKMTLSYCWIVQFMNKVLYGLVNLSTTTVLLKYYHHTPYTSLIVPLKAMSFEACKYVSDSLSEDYFRLVLQN